MAAYSPHSLVALLRWVVGAVLGVPIGLFLAVVPTLGLIVGALAAVWAGAGRPRLSAFSGLLMGTGTTYVALLVRARDDCQTTVAAGYLQQCRPPDDLNVYLSSALAVLLVGILLLGAHLVHAMRDRTTRREEEV